MRLRFGVYVNPQTPGPADDGRIIDEVLGQVDLAETIGYEDVWMTEHHFTGYNAYSDPMMLATAISQRNPSMKIGFSIAIAALNEPVRFVTQCNLLDRLSGGKLVVGMGPGNSPDEFRGFGQDANQRHAKMDEFMDLAHKLWANQNNEGIQHQGEFYTSSIRGRIIPSPVQKPHPHIAMATSTTSKVANIAKQGYSLLIGPQDVKVVALRMKLYADALNESGLDEATKARCLLDTGQLRQIYCAAPGENWRETIGEYIRTYTVKSVLANSGIDDLPKADIDARVEKYLENWLLAGTADELYERLLPSARIGVSHIMAWHTFGHMPDHLVRPSMLRFSADVMPRLRDVTLDEEYRNSLIDEVALAAR